MILLKTIRIRQRIEAVMCKCKLATRCRIEAMFPALSYRLDIYNRSAQRCNSKFSALRLGAAVTSALDQPNLVIINPERYTSALQGGGCSWDCTSGM